ncbi:alanine--glyoxylate aminotransferase family protein [Paraburkholderia sp. JPY432]|uniref:aminotransferase class V-fold PLP-dependent enzyme n=1 Tax=Paraburkholderia youngii TaxID=2782701 RepID=UPI0015962234|nr:aminotransferase class V-fold PLP-dependent enzyme [Paraburkholderia youngii]NVH74168.1 alanine--glyoxylate aminotransferase family protein [Paraburkholderia youngii]
MQTFDRYWLVDVPRYPDHGYALLAERIKRLLKTSADVLFVQAEAVLALEAVAASIARQGIVAVNVVTSPYGRWFGGWLRRGGAIVHDVVATMGQPVESSAVANCLETLEHVDIVAAVHAESSSGALNPLAQLAALAKSRHALFAVDAVASIGGHVIDVDGLGIDIAVIGPQKALAGPAGLSAVVLGQRALDHIAKMPDFAPSSLSLAALKRDWLDRGRPGLPGTPSALEFWALEAALDRIEAEGKDCGRRARGTKRNALGRAWGHRLSFLCGRGVLSGAELGGKPCASVTVLSGASVARRSSGSRGSARRPAARFSARRSS